MNDLTEHGRLVPVFIKLPPENIVAIKFIIESYDGLGIVRTLNPDTGEVVILAIEDTVNEINKILENLTKDLGLRVIPGPANIKEDWLLA